MELVVSQHPEAESTPSLLRVLSRDPLTVGFVRGS